MTTRVVDIGTAAHGRHEEVRRLDAHQEFVNSFLNALQVPSGSVDGTNTATLFLLSLGPIEIGGTVQFGIFCR